MCDPRQLLIFSLLLLSASALWVALERPRVTSRQSHRQLKSLAETDFLWADEAFDNAESAISIHKNLPEEVDDADIDFQVGEEEYDDTDLKADEEADDTTADLDAVSQVPVAETEDDEELEEVPAKTMVQNMLEEPDEAKPDPQHKKNKKQRKKQENKEDDSDDDEDFDLDETKINQEDNHTVGEDETTQQPSGGNADDDSGDETDDDDEDGAQDGGGEGGGTGENGVSDIETDDNSIAALMAESDEDETAVGDEDAWKYAKDKDFELPTLKRIDHMFDDMLNDDVLKDDSLLKPTHHVHETKTSLKRKEHLDREPEHPALRPEPERQQPADSKVEPGSQKHAEFDDSKVEPGEKKTGKSGVVAKVVFENKGKFVNSLGETLERQGVTKMDNVDKKRLVEDEKKERDEQKAKAKQAYKEEKAKEAAKLDLAREKKAQEQLKAKAKEELKKVQDQKKKKEVISGPSKASLMEEAKRKLMKDKAREAARAEIAKEKEEKEREELKKTALKPGDSMLAAKRELQAEFAKRRDAIKKEEQVLESDPKYMKLVRSINKNKDKLKAEKQSKVFFYHKGQAKLLKSQIKDLLAQADESKATPPKDESVLNWDPHHVLGRKDRISRNFGKSAKLSQREKDRKISFADDLSDEVQTSTPSTRRILTPVTISLVVAGLYGVMVVYHRWRQCKREGDEYSLLRDPIIESQYEELGL